MNLRRCKIQPDTKKRKGPRTKAPFTSHHPLPPKRSFNIKLTDSGQLAAEIGQFYPVHTSLEVSDLLV